jgi:hypothetical protein
MSPPRDSAGQHADGCGVRAAPHDSVPVRLARSRLNGFAIVLPFLAL